jgi:hypothetical protein
VGELRPGRNTADQDQNQGPNAATVIAPPDTGDGHSSSEGTFDLRLCLISG